MKAVMISINPKWCELIARGKKTIELRKTKPNIKTPFKCYIYCTYGNALADFSNCCCKSIEDDVKKGIANRYVLQDHKIMEPVYSTCAYGNGKVIGEFVCDKVYNLVHCGAGIMFANEDCTEQLAPQLFRDMSCLTDENTSEYLDSKDGYGWHISDLKIYDKPKELGEFLNLKGKAIKRPSQSWGYVIDYSLCDLTYFKPSRCLKCEDVVFNNCKIKLLEVEE